MTFLGIDLGTSGLRAVLVGQDGTSIGAAERHYEVAHPHHGWAEQDPKDWLTALDGAIEELRETYGAFKELKGIGVAGHMHGATLIDSDNQVLRPCILWNDTRSHAQAARLDQVASVRDLSGNIVFPGFTAPKLLWVEENEPEIFKDVAKVLLPVAYMNFYLTGEHVADMSDSAGTSWLDVGRREWSETLLAAGHMTEDQMPRLVEGTEIAGELRPELAERWGLSGPVIVAGGAGDNAAAACGIGVMKRGQGFVSLGTSGVFLVARDTYRPAPETAVHTFCHAIPETWYQMGVMLSATDSLNWLSKISGHSPAELTSALGKDLRRPGQVRFLPYLSGERTPHNDAVIRGSFTGLSTQTSLADMTQAVLEGVAFGLCDSFEALKETGASFDHIYAIGGGTGSRYWVELIATVLQIPLHLPEQGDFGAALGAARLGICAATGTDARDVMIAPATAEIVHPVSGLVTEFEDAYRRFKHAYPAIKSAQ